MRRTVLFVLMISLLLLSACAGAEGWEERLQRERETWQRAQRLDFVAELRADLGESVFCCTLEGSRSPGELNLCFLEPEMAKGIRLRQTAEDTQLLYEGLALSVGALAGSELSPAEALPLLLEALLRGHLTELYQEKNEENTIVCVQMYVDDGIYALFRFDESLKPLQGELVSGERTVATVYFQSFTSEQGVSDNETPDYEDLG